jgi:hypothetical protein
LLISEHFSSIGLGIGFALFREAPDARAGATGNVSVKRAIKLFSLKFMTSHLTGCIKLAYYIAPEILINLILTETWA